MIRGLALQGRASIITMVGYWVIGVPVSCFFVFQLHGGIVGLWTGPAVGIGFNMTCFVILVISTNWQNIADAAAAAHAKKETKANLLIQKTDDDE